MVDCAGVAHEQLSSLIDDGQGLASIVRTPALQPFSHSFPVDELAKDADGRKAPDKSPNPKIGLDCRFWDMCPTVRA